MKGGVGKTTLSIGIADFLSKAMKKVLVIDADPQFNATQTLLDAYINDEDSNYYLTEIKPKSKTIYRIFNNDDSVYNPSVSVPSDDIIINLSKDLDIICGDLDLIMINSTSHYTIYSLRDFIDDNKLKEKYDYIIIDCPPTITLYSDSALMASDFYLIPNKIDKYSIIGITSLMSVINKLVKKEKINLHCIGLVYTLVDSSASPVKQKDLKIEFESKIPKDQITIFNSVQHYSATGIYGRQGALPTKYVATKDDIEAITRELIEKIDLYNRSVNLC